VTTPEEAGPLSQKVLGYEAAMRRLVPTVRVRQDWQPLTEFVAVEDFERVGTFMEHQDWRAYTEMLTQWADSIDSFETSVQRVSESGNLVYYEIEERHRRGGNVSVVNSLTVFEFGDDAKIRRLAVYLQQPR
jgi:hypothetical protein